MAQDGTADLGIPGLGPATWVAAGGFADVYRARQQSLHRDVAVKVLRNWALDEHARSRFERECQAIGSLSGHPNIVGVHDSGFTVDGRPFLVMDFVSGGSLADHGGPLPWSRASEIMVKIGKALAVAHRVGVVHRDIKPENILLSAFDEPLLADFGIARVEGGLQTQTGALTVTLYHAAPELLEGKGPTIASDVYALGSTLFTLLAGHAPYSRGLEEDSAAAMVMRIVTEPIPDARRIGIPDPIVRVIETAMSRDPRDRYATAGAFADALVTAIVEARGPGSSGPIPPLPSMAPEATTQIPAPGVGTGPPMGPPTGPPQAAPTTTPGTPGTAATSEPQPLAELAVSGDHGSPGLAGVAPPRTADIEPTRGARRRKWPLGVAALVAVAAAAVLFVVLSGGSDGDRPAAIPRGPALPDGTLVLTTIDPTWEISALDTGSGLVTKLTVNNAGSSKLPALSPDRESVAYTWQRDNVNELWIVSSDGASQHKYATGLNPDARATWSPDGTRLAYVSEAQGQQDVVILDLRSGDVEALTNDAGQEGDPAWSPDGASIALWKSGPGGNLDLYTIDVASKEPTRQTTDAAADADPAWNFDGSRLAFARASSTGCSSIWTRDMASGTEFQVTHGDTEQRDDTDPTWSPQGQQIAFESRAACDPSQDLDIEVVNADGSGLRSLTNDPVMEFHPSW